MGRAEAFSLELLGRRSRLLRNPQTFWPVTRMDYGIGLEILSGTYGEGA